MSTTPTIEAKEATMSQFFTTTPGTLPAGTVTEFGAIMCSTLTAYEMADGSFVPFSKVHGPYAPAEPLVIFGG